MPLPVCIEKPFFTVCDIRLLGQGAEVFPFCVKYFLVTLLTIVC